MEQSIAEGKGVDLGERLTLDYELSLAAAELAWLDGTLARLSKPSLSVEAAENEDRDFATLTV